jgi:hypothetical protein
MNIGRGLFRLWVVGTVVFAGGVAAVTAEDIVSEFRTQSLQHELEMAEPFIPVLCGKARGKIVSTSTQASRGSQDRGRV